jgi:hypothetical protein
MGKILTVVLGLGVLVWGAWYSLNRTASAGAGADRSAPAQKLDNVRGAAQRIENDAQKSADEMMRKTQSD